MEGSQEEIQNLPGLPEPEPQVTFHLLVLIGCGWFQKGLQDPVGGGAEGSKNNLTELKILKLKISTLFSTG